MASLAGRVGGVVKVHFVEYFGKIKDMSIISWLRNKSVEIFAKGIAKTQLSTLRHLYNQNPELFGEALYEQVIILRPTYNSEKAKKIIKEAKESFERTAWIKTSTESKFCFRDVVEQLIIREYFKGNSGYDAIAITIILSVVREIIPADL